MRNKVLKPRKIRYDTPSGEYVEFGDPVLDPAVGTSSSSFCLFNFFFFVSIHFVSILFFIFSSSSSSLV